MCCNDIQQIAYVDATRSLPICDSLLLQSAGFGTASCGKIEAAYAATGTIIHTFSRKTKSIDIVLCSAIDVVVVVAQRRTISPTMLTELCNAFSIVYAFEMILPNNIVNLFYSADVAFVYSLFVSLGVGECLRLKLAQLLSSGGFCVTLGM